MQASVTVLEDNRVKLTVEVDSAAIEKAIEATAKVFAEDINIKRRAVYAQKAQEQHATIEDYAFTSGCVLIAQTKVGEKYQGPNGTWETRTSAAPLRDARCP